MTYETIQVNPLTPRIGAEIGGIDLSRPLGNQTFAEVHDALMEHQVIFFRDQDMTVEQHKAFACLFGELHIHPILGAGDSGHPELLILRADETTKYAAGSVGWHSDVSADAEPPMGSILHLTEVPCILHLARCPVPAATPCFPACTRLTRISPTPCSGFSET